MQFPPSYIKQEAAKHVIEPLVKPEILTGPAEQGSYSPPDYIKQEAAKHVIEPLTTYDTVPKDPEVEFLSVDEGREHLYNMWAERNFAEKIAPEPETLNAAIPIEDIGERESQRMRELGIAQEMVRLAQKDVRRFSPKTSFTLFPDPTLDDLPPPKKSTLEHIRKFGPGAMSQFGRARKYAHLANQLVQGAISEWQLSERMNYIPESDWPVLEAAIHAAEKPDESGFFNKAGSRVKRAVLDLARMPSNVAFDLIPMGAVTDAIGFTEDAGRITQQKARIRDAIKSRVPYKGGGTIEEGVLMAAEMGPSVAASIPLYFIPGAQFVGPMKYLNMSKKSFAATTAFWGAPEAVNLKHELRNMGFDDYRSTAAAVAGGSVIGALENVMPPLKTIAPTGGLAGKLIKSAQNAVSENVKKAVQGSITRRAIGEFGKETLKTGAVEFIEEVAQGAAAAAAKEIAGWSHPEISVDFKGELTDQLESLPEIAVAIATLMAPGTIIGGLNTAQKAVAAENIRRIALQPGGIKALASMKDADGNLLYADTFRKIASTNVKYDEAPSRSDLPPAFNLAFGSKSLRHELKRRIINESQMLEDIGILEEGTVQRREEKRAAGQAEPAKTTQEVIQEEVGSPLTFEQTQSDIKQIRKQGEKAGSDALLAYLATRALEISPENNTPVMAKAPQAAQFARLAGGNVRPGLKLENSPSSIIGLDELNELVPEEGGEIEIPSMGRVALMLPTKHSSADIAKAIDALPRPIANVGLSDGSRLIVAERDIEVPRTIEGENLSPEEAGEILEPLFSGEISEDQSEFAEPIDGMLADGEPDGGNFDDMNIAKDVDENILNAAAPAARSDDVSGSPVELGRGAAVNAERIQESVDPAERSDVEDRFQPYDVPVRYHKTNLETIESFRAARRDGTEVSSGANVYDMIRQLARSLGLAQPGIGRSGLLVKHNTGTGGKYGGWIRPSNSEIRLWWAGAASTFAHEIGHHLHSIMFRRTRNLTKKQRTLSPYAQERVLKPKEFPKSWRAELAEAGRRLYGDTKPTSGYEAEGWAEFVRMIVMNPVQAKSDLPTVYRSFMTVFPSRHPVVWAAITAAREQFYAAITASKNNPIKGVIARGVRLIDRDDWLGKRARQFIRGVDDRYYQYLAVEKHIFGGAGVDAALSPYVAARRRAGHTAEDYEKIAKRGIWDLNTGKEIGPSILGALQPIENRLEIFGEWLVARRVLEKRLQERKRASESGAPARFLWEASPTGGYKTTQGKMDYSDAALQKFIDKVSSENPEFQEANEKLQRINRWLIQEYAVRYGLLSEDDAAKIIAMNMDYITFKFIKTDSVSQGRSQSPRGPANIGTGIKHFSWNEGFQIQDPLVSFYQHVHRVVTNAQLNNVALKLVGLEHQGVPHGRGSGQFFRRVQSPLKANKVSSDVVQSEVFKQLGIETDKDGNYNLPPWLAELGEDAAGVVIENLEALEGIAQYYKSPDPDASRGEIAVWVGGKKVLYEVVDPELYRTVMGDFEPLPSDHTILKLLRPPMAMLRYGTVVAYPAWAMANIIRDIWVAMTTTKSRSVRSILKDLTKLKVPQQVKDRITGMIQAFRGGDWADLYESSGANYSTIIAQLRAMSSRQEISESQMSLLDRALSFAKIHNKRDIRSMLKQSRALGLTKTSVSAQEDPKRFAREAIGDFVSFGWAMRLGESLERSTRLGEFIVAMKEGVGIEEAGMRASEITIDFARGGTWTKELNDAILFFNATVQGTSKLARGFRDNPTNFLARAFAYLVMPSMVLTLLYGDDEDYNQIPIWERDAYWFVSTGTDKYGKRDWIKIPKPYGYRFLSNSTERFLMTMVGRNPLTGERGNWSGMHPAELSRMIFNEFSIGIPTVPGITPIVEVMAGELGWSFWSGKTIVPQSDQSLPVEERGARYASSFARAMAEVFADAYRAVGMSPSISPAKIDHIVRGFFGGLGRDAVSIMDWPLKAAKIDNGPHRPIRAEDMAIIRRFFRNGNDGRTEAISRFYENFRYYSGIRATAKFRASQGDDSYAIQHLPEIAMWQSYNDAKRAIGDTVKFIKQVDFADVDSPAWNQIMASLPSKWRDQIESQATPEDGREMLLTLLSDHMNDIAKEGAKRAERAAQYGVKRRKQILDQQKAAQRN